MKTLSQKLADVFYKARIKNKNKLSYQLIMLALLLIWVLGVVYWFNHIDILFASISAISNQTANIVNWLCAVCLLFLIGFDLYWFYIFTPQKLTETGLNYSILAIIFIPVAWIIGFFLMLFFGWLIILIDIHKVLNKKEIKI